MTTPAHAVSSGLIGYITTESIAIAIVFTILGMVPDLVRFLQKDSSDWSRYYNLFHKPWLSSTRNGLWMMAIWVLIPPIGIHCALDFAMHNLKTGKWNAFAYIGEVVVWVFTVLFIGMIT